MTREEHVKSGGLGYFDPITNGYYTEMQYAELITEREIAAVPEKVSKTKPAVVSIDNATPKKPDENLI